MSLRRPILGALAALTVAAFASPSALADKRGDDKIKNHPAYVHEPGLLQFATGDSHIVEVTVKGALLRSVAKIAGAEDPDFEAFLSNLLAVNALIIEKWRGDEDRVAHDMRNLIDDLGEDWERIVRIRDPRETIQVFIHSHDEEDIDGLLVLIHGENQIVFANIVGPIDLEFVASMSGHFQIPGLDRVPRERPDRTEQSRLDDSRSDREGRAT